jgi:hypothetical protein
MTMADISGNVITDPKTFNSVHVVAVAVQGAAVPLQPQVDRPEGALVFSAVMEKAGLYSLQVPHLQSPPPSPLFRACACCCDTCTPYCATPPCIASAPSLCLQLWSLHPLLCD